MTTRSACVRVRPRPPTPEVRRKTCMDWSVWKRSTRACRSSALATLPSIRQKEKFRSKRAISTMSRSFRLWENTSVRCPVSDNCCSSARVNAVLHEASISSAPPSAGDPAPSRAPAPLDPSAAPPEGRGGLDSNIRRQPWSVRDSRKSFTAAVVCSSFSRRSISSVARSLSSAGWSQIFFKTLIAASAVPVRFRASRTVLDRRNAR